MLRNKNILKMRNNLIFIVDWDTQVKSDEMTMTVLVGNKSENI